MLGKLRRFLNSEYAMPSESRAIEIYKASYQSIAEKTDLIFAGLFAFQWLLGISFALFYSPLSWNGTSSNIHFHVYLAVFLGGTLAGYPIFLNLRRPGKTLNRFIAAISQIGFSILFIHVTGGRIETHFHIFGSLAFLAFYRDVRVLLLATLLTAIDHLIRGAYSPQSVYGVLTATPWRALEHAAWVVFEDVFLIISIHIGLRELASIAEKQSEIEKTLVSVEKQVAERTADLLASRETILQQQKTIVATSKMTALGEMAGGVAHEVNNPIAVIKNFSSQLTELFDEKCADYRMLREMSIEIEKSTDRIGRIITGLKTFSEISVTEAFADCSLRTLVEQAFAFYPQKFLEKSTILQTESIVPEYRFPGRIAELTQVFAILFLNSLDAIQKTSGQKADNWIRVTARPAQDSIEIYIEDSGGGVEENLRSRIFQPFFTTKDIGDGLGLGLSIALGIVRSHGGDLYLDLNQAHTRFVLKLPRGSSKRSGIAA